jgi:hypothetical protein
MTDGTVGSRLRDTGHASSDYDLVIRTASEIHAAHWQMSGDESIGDKLASMITLKWQQQLQAEAPGRFEVEYQVAPHLNHLIDVDVVIAGVAFELKVSPNKAHMECYRDIFKVILARDNRLPGLNKFVFITPASAARSLNRGMGQAVISDGERLGLSIEVVSLYTVADVKQAKIAELEEQIRLLKAKLLVAGSS